MKLNYPDVKVNGTDGTVYMYRAFNAAQMAHEDAIEQGKAVSLLWRNSDGFWAFTVKVETCP